MDRSDFIAQLQQLTQTLMNELYETDFKQIELFVEKREGLVEKLANHFSTDPASSEEKNEIEQILRNDSEIVARMNVLRLEAQEWLHKRGQAKTQRNAYEVAYTPDSFLMDRKK